MNRLNFQTMVMHLALWKAMLRWSFLSLLRPTNPKNMHLGNRVNLLVTFASRFFSIYLCLMPFSDISSVIGNLKLKETLYTLCGTFATCGCVMVLWNVWDGNNKKRLYQS